MWLDLAWLDLAWIELQCTVLCYIYASEWNGSNKWKMKCQYIQATMQMFSEHLFSYGYNTYLSMHATHQIAVISVFVHNVPHITHEWHVAISWSDGIINATMFGFHNLLVLIDDHKASGKSYIWCLADESLQPGKITKFVENGSSFIYIQTQYQLQLQIHLISSARCDVIAAPIVLIRFIHKKYIICKNTHTSIFTFMIQGANAKLESIKSTHTHTHTCSQSSF